MRQAASARHGDIPPIRRDDCLADWPLVEEICRRYPGRVPQEWLRRNGGHVREIVAPVDHDGRRGLENCPKDVCFIVTTCHRILGHFQAPYSFVVGAGQQNLSTASDPRRTGYAFKPLLVISGRNTRIGSKTVASELAKHAPRTPAPLESCKEAIPVGRIA